MKREEFDALIKQLEQRAARSRDGLRWNTGVWALFGFGYLGFVLVASVGLTLGLVALMIFVPNAATIKLGILFGIVTGGLSWAILRGLFVKMEPPEGLRLQPKHAPKLFKLVEALRKHLQAPHFHEILLTGEHNAGVVQMPRLGMFGWHRNYLVLGLPLLQGVSVEEFRAILAHEFAHLSGSHGKHGAWIYRLRRTWEQIVGQMQARQQGGGLVLGKFLGWFWPRFNARAFVLSRVQEYEADALAARVTTPVALAMGLIRTQVQGRWLEEKFWPEVYGRVKAEAAPPMTLFSELGTRIGGLHALPETSRWLTQAYHLETNNADTHPCLKDRLKALRGLPPEFYTQMPPAVLPPPLEVDAAEVLLGAGVAPMAQEINQRWQKAVGPGWQEQHRTAQKLATELAEVEAKGEESLEALWKRVEIILQRDGDEAAQELVGKVLELEPKHAEANFVRGRFLLAQEDEAGVAHLERAMQLDAFATQAGCDLLYGYYTRNGRREMLKPLEQRSDAYQEQLAKANAERATATAKETYTSPLLTPEQHAHVVAVMQAQRDIAAVHVARKLVQYFPQRPMFVLALTIKARWWTLRSSAANGKVVQAVVGQLQLPGNFLVFVVEGNLTGLGKRIRKVSGSEIYRRAR